MVEFGAEHQLQRENLKKQQKKKKKNRVTNWHDGNLLLISN